jgi:hypothetical protein
LSVIGGLQALGPIGIVVGPMAVVFLQTLLKLLQRELSSLDRSSWTFWRGLGAAGPSAAAVETVQDADAPPAESAPPASGNGSSAPASPRPAKPAKSGKKRRK